MTDCGISSTISIWACPTNSSAEKWQVTRVDQDRFAAQSYRRAVKAVRDGVFKDEIVPVPIPQKNGEMKLFDQR